MDRPAEPNAAFTVAELLVGVAVLAILLAGGTVTWQALGAGIDLARAERQLATDLRAARALARASARTVRLVLPVGGARYRRDCGATAAACPLRAVRTLPAGVTIAAVSSGGDVTFAPSGVAENARVALRSRRGSVRAVIVNQRGRVTVRPWTS